MKKCVECNIKNVSPGQTYYCETCYPERVRKHKEQIEWQRKVIREEYCEGVILMK